MRVTAQFQSATLYHLTASVGSQLALPANNNRLGWVITNDSPADLYIRYGQGPANSSNFTAILAPIDLTAAVRSSEVTHEHAGLGIYVGELHVAWGSATGSLHITELT